MFEINNILWKILFVPFNYYILQRPSGDYTLGATVSDTKTIYIVDNLSMQQTKKVLCHELTHAAMFSYNVYLSLDQEELLADLIATYGEEIIYITNKIFKKIQKK